MRSIKLNDEGTEAAINDDGVLLIYETIGQTEPTAFTLRPTELAALDAWRGVGSMAELDRLRAEAAVLREQYDQFTHDAKQDRQAAALRIEQLKAQIAKLEGAGKDWRLGLAVKPKLRTHPHYGNIGIVRRINRASESIKESLFIELWTESGEPALYNEPSEEWMTA